MNEKKKIWRNVNQGIYCSPLNESETRNLITDHLTRMGYVIGIVLFDWTWASADLLCSVYRSVMRDLRIFYSTDFFFGQFFRSRYMTNTDPLTTFIFFTQCHLNSLIATIKGQRCLVDSTTWRHHSDLFWSVVTWHDQDQINCSTLKDDVTIHLLTSLYFNQTTDCCCFKNIFSTYFRDF